MNKRDFDEKLIIEVHSHAPIYDKLCREYKLRDKKDDAWRAIADALGVEGKHQQIK